MNYQEIVSQWNEWLQQGQIKRVQDGLLGINPKKVPPQFRFPIAKIAHSTAQFSFGLRLLTPIIHKKDEFWQREPTDDEKVIYGVLLQRSGVVDEAINVLSQIDTDRHPKALLYRAFCHFNQWNYELARPLLEAYVNHPQVPEYDLLIGQVNLLSCLVTLSELDQASTLFRFIEKEAKQKNYTRLLGNCFELVSQVHIKRKDWKMAEDYLNRAHSILSNNSTRDLLFVKKWMAYLESSKTQSPQAIFDFKQLAKEQGHWESVRDADHLSLDFEFDEKVFLNLVFGTPHTFYVKKLLNQFPHMEIPDHCIFGNTSNYYDLDTGIWMNEKILSPGGLVHQLSSCLFLDFYSPVSIGTMFSRLYKGDYFDIYSSPKKVHQLITRFRKILRDSKVPATLTENNGFFSISRGDEFGLKVPFSNRIMDKDSVAEKLLQTQFSGETITRKDIMKVLEMPTPTAVRAIKRLVDKGVLVKIGKGKSTRYKLTG